MLISSGFYAIKLGDWRHIAYVCTMLITMCFLQYREEIFRRETVRSYASLRFWEVLRPFLYLISGTIYACVFGTVLRSANHTERNAFWPHILPQ